MESISKPRLLIPAQVKTIQSRFDYSATWAFLHDKGVELFGKNFHLYPEDTDVLLKLIAWYLRDEAVTAMKLKPCMACGYAADAVKCSTW